MGGDILRWLFDPSFVEPPDVRSQWNRTVLALLVSLILLLLYLGNWVYRAVCSLAGHCYAMLKRCWQPTRQWCLRAHAATKSVLCILRRKNQVIENLGSKLTAAEETISELRATIQRAKDSSREREANHESEKVTLREDISAQQFQIRKLEQRPKTAEAGTVPYPPDNWEPFETIRPKLD